MLSNGKFSQQRIAYTLAAEPHEAAAEGLATGRIRPSMFEDEVWKGLLRKYRKLHGALVSSLSLSPSTHTHIRTHLVYVGL